jgi:hypothetical protein
MSGLFWFAAVLMACGALIFREAATQLKNGTDWAYKTCGAAETFCLHPEYLGYAAGIVFVLAIAVTISEATS